MYSLVLMTALSTTPSTPEFNGYFRDLFSGRNCNGCSGSASPPRYSCYGGQACSGSSAYPAGCSSSQSNSCSGDTFRNRVRRFFDRGNCCGGSGSGYGCTGSRYGCSGTANSCFGSAAYSCFGTSVYSCFGSPAVSYTPVFNGGQSCFGGPTPSAPPPNFESFPSYPAIPAPGPGGPPPTIPYAPPEPAPGNNPQNTGLRPAAHGGSALVSSGNSATRATVLVKLPADARLYADNRPMVQNGSERKFVSPELPTGQEFTYRFRVEYDRDGETVSVTKKVPVRAGGSVTVEFTDLTAKSAPEKLPVKPGSGPVAVTPTSNPVSGTSTGSSPITPVVPPASSMIPTAPSDRATITVKLPPGATLYVDDRRSPSTEPVRRFSTPLLPPGRDFSYLMKAEVVRNGQMETFTQKVPFRAGERVEVDFTNVGR